MTMVVGMVCAWCWLSIYSVKPQHEGKTARWWLEQLVRSDRDRDGAAVSAFLAMGPEAVPTLAGALDRWDSPIHRVLHWGGTKVGLSDLGWIPAVEYRMGALKVLGRLGPEGRGALPAVLGALERGVGPHEAHTIQSVLIGMGPEVMAELVPVLERTRHAQVVRVVLTTWGEFLSSATVEMALLTAVRSGAIAALGSTDDRVVMAAAGVVMRLGPDAEAAIPSLLEVLHTPGWMTGPVAESVVLALGRIGRDPERVIPVLAGCLGTADEGLRIGAARALGMFGPKAEKAVAELTRALWTPDDRAFPAVADALGRIGAGAWGSCPALVRGLDHEQAFIRVLAANNLVRVGAEPELVVPALGRALGDVDPYVRGRVALALGQLGVVAVPAVSVLAEALSDQDESVQVAVIEALGAIGPGAHPAVPQLHRARSNKQSGLGRHVLAALARIEVEETE